MLASSLRRSGRRPAAVVALILAVLLGLSLAGAPARAADTGRISGTARSTTGKGVSGIRVAVYAETPQGGWNVVATTTTAARGTYAVSGLADATYRVGFTDPNGTYAAEYWEDQGYFYAATDVVVTSGGAVGGIDPVLERPGRVTGLVTDSHGVGLGQITVRTHYQFDPGGWVTLTSTQTSADGTYALDLLPGSYRMEFYDSTGIHVGQYYDQASDFSQATDLPVTQAATTAGIDAHLASASRMTGTVTGPGHVAAPGVQVSVYLVQGLGNYQYVGYSMTDANGQYELGGLAPGHYIVQLQDDQGGRYLSEYYDNQTDADHADEIEVGAETTVSGVDAELSAAAQITGRLTTADGLAIGRVYATAYQRAGKTWSYAGFASVHSDGSYRIGSLRAGTYRVGFTDADHSYAPQFWSNRTSLAKANNIVLAAGGSRAGIDAELHPGSHVTGQVVDHVGQPLAGVTVTAYAHDSVSGYWTSLAQASTTSTGAYDLGGLAAGSYRLAFDDPTGGHLPEYWNDQTSLDRATPIRVLDAATVTGKDAALSDAAHITGRVTSSDGSALGNVFVEAFHLDASTGDVDGSSFADTAADGTFSLGGLVTGDWKLQFVDSTGDHVAEYFDDKPTLASADPVYVTPGGTVSGQNAQLATSSHITGTVTGPDGHGVGGVYVEAYDVDPDHDVYFGGVTDASGAYDVGDLTPGTYRLRFQPSDDAYARQFWKNKPTSDQATGIKVGPEAVVAGKDVRLAPAGHVTGTVTGPGGAPVYGAGAEAYTFNPATHTWTTFAGVLTDHTGHYDIGSLPANTYRIGFSELIASDYAQQFWQDKPDLASATDVVVGTGTTVPGTDAHLTAGSTISGRLTDAARHGVAVDVEVYRRDPTGSFEDYAYAYADQTGHYTVAGLPPGSYRLRFRPTDRALEEEWYDDAETLVTATDVLVTRSGEAVTGKGAVLSSAAPAADLTAGPAPCSRATSAPTIQGTATVGSPMVVKPSGTTSPSCPVIYQWLVDGVDVPGARGPTYTPRLDDVGRSVAVRTVTPGVTPGGLGPMAFASQASAPVAAATSASHG